MDTEGSGVGSPPPFGRWDPRRPFDPMSEDAASILNVPSMSEKE